MLNTDEMVNCRCCCKHDSQYRAVYITKFWISPPTSISNAMLHKCVLQIDLESNAIIVQYDL